MSDKRASKYHFSHIWSSRGYVVVGRNFILGATVLLAITGASKILSALGDARSLSALDPILGLSLRQIFFLSGATELSVVAFCYAKKQDMRLCLYAICWLATTFLAYRAGAWMLGWERPFGCLGELPRLLRLSSATAEATIKCLLGYLVVGSYSLLLFRPKVPSERGNGVHDNILAQSHTSLI